MSDYFIKVVKVGPVTKHPNADSLSITTVMDGYQVIFNHNQHAHKEGDKAIYITVDALLPVDREEFSFLKKGEFQTTHRLKAMKLRGIFSMGMLLPCDQSLEEGTDMAEALGITKWEPIEETTMGGECEKDPGFFPTYYDIESLRKYRNNIPVGTEVVLTEKVHGANGRWLYHNDRLWVGSHHQIKRFDQSNMWWKVAASYNLEDKLKQFPGIAVYGEVYGSVQDLKYGAQPGQLLLTLFDALDIKTHRYLDYDVFIQLCNKLELPHTPVMYRGPWSQSLIDVYGEGKTLTGSNKDQIREGFVVRTTQEDKVGRSVYKYVSESYLTRKEK